MAINIEELLADTLLALCREKPFREVTVKDIRERSGVSRTGFYNHFRDKNDLVQWIYYHRIQTPFQLIQIEEVDHYYDALVDYYKRVAAYHDFLKAALAVSGQNCLREYLYAHPLEWELAYHVRWCQKNIGEVPDMEKLIFFTEYHSSGAASMTIKWIENDMPISPEEIARRIAYLKQVGFAEILHDDSGHDRHPYK